MILHQVWCHLCLSFLVRLGGYIANLSDFYSYRLIGKLTVFLQLQESSLRNTTVDCSTSSTRHTLFISSQNVENYSLRLQVENISFINLVSIFRCSSLPRNPVYVSRVDSSVLDFSLSSHRHTYVSKTSL
jgi:hypothetical protein